MSTVERLSTLQRGKCISTVERHIFGSSESVLCDNFYVLYLVCPLAEAPLYM